MMINSAAASSLQSPARDTSSSALRPRAFIAVKRAGRSLLTLLEAAGAFLDAFFGLDGSFAFIGEHRGYFGGLCVNGCLDVHDLDESCPRQLVGECSACGQTIELDRAGNCPTQRPTHRVVNRRFKHSKLTARSYRGALQSKSPERIGAAAG